MKNTLLPIILVSFFCNKIEPSNPDPKIPEYIFKKYNNQVKSPTPWLKNRTELLKILPKGKIVAEIGVQRGIFSDEILLLTLPKKLYLIDCWHEQDQNIYTETSSNLENEKQEQLFNEVKNRFSIFPHVNILKAFSPEITNNFPDNFFDWIYIDANHSYEAVKKDLEAWLPKVKPGGIIAGHDYVNEYDFGVVAAVNEFIDKHNLKLKYLTNSDHWLSYGIEK